MARFPAITLHQPWAHLVAHHGKDIENRTWPPPAKLIGRRIAIHAAKRRSVDTEWGELYWEFDGYTHGITVDDLDGERGHLVAVATLDGYLEPVQVLDGETITIGSSRHWWMPCHYGWLLTDVVALPEPIPCKGAQRIWYLPDDVAETVRTQDDKAHSNTHQTGKIQRGQSVQDSDLS